MKFAAPIWLWACAAVPFLILLIRLDIHRRQKVFSKFADESLWKFIAPDLDWNLRFRKSVIWLSALFMVCLSLARPQWGKTEETVKVSGLDIVFVLDVSNSMMVEDIVPSRLKKAKRLIRSITEQIEGDRAGVIAFAESNYLAVPITTDLEYLRDTLDILDTRSVATQGTNIGSALMTGMKALERAAEDPTRAAISGKITKVEILLSDGEDHDDEFDAVLPKLKEAGVKVLTLGIGSERGGPIPVRDETGQLRGYKRDSGGKVVLSQFHPKELMDATSRAGGQYWNATSSEDEVKEIVEMLNGLSRGEFGEKKIITFKERFQIPLLIAVLLLLIELTVSNRKRAAQLALVFLCFSSFGRADAFPGESYFENKKGIESLGKDQPDEAIKHFEEAQKQNPNRAEPKFNQAIADLKKGDVDSALKGFDQATEAARAQGDARLEAESLYNKGAVSAQKGDADVAAESYLGAIDAAKRAGDNRLLQDAKKNLELLSQQEEEKKKQQEQNKDDKKDEKKQDQNQQQDQKNDQKKDSSGNQSKDQKNDQNKDKDKDKDSDKEKEKQKQQQKQDEKEGRKKPQEFQSNKISKDSAKRVMSELSSREKELQGKLKKQKGQPQAVEKDW